MSDPFDSIEDALLVLANPQDPAWGEAFQLLASHPDTAELMLETFRETLRQLGVEPSGRDPQTGEPIYALDDVARALGLAAQDLAGDPQGL